MNKGTELKGRLDRIGKTPLEHFQDIKELEVADGPEIKVEDIVPYKCKQVEKALLRLEAIDNAEPSKAMECLEYICKILKEKRIDIKWLFKEDYNIIIKALQRLEKYEQILGNGRLTDRNYKNTTLDLDNCKPYLRLGQLEDIYEEGK